MVDERRVALERRVWRLAFLLTGDQEGAAALVDRILDAQSNLDALEPARLDRLVIQQAREMMGVRVPPPLSHAPAAAEAIAKGLAAAHALSAQPREAWILSRIDMVDDLWMSRAMDCSKTAARQHLQGGEDTMRNRLGDDYDAVVRALRSFADGLDPGPVIAANRAARKKARLRRRTAVFIVVGLVVMLALLVVVRETHLL
jgi:hypothetical protein